MLAINAPPVPFSLALLAAAAAMVIGAPLVARLRARAHSFAVTLFRVLVVASLGYSLVGCSPAERCAAARGATVAARVVEHLAARACSGELVIGSSGDELEVDATPDERAEARALLEQAAEELRDDAE